MAFSSMSAWAVVNGMPNDVITRFRATEDDPSTTGKLNVVVTGVVMELIVFEN